MNHALALKWTRNRLDFKQNVADRVHILSRNSFSSLFYKYPPSNHVPMQLSLITQPFKGESEKFF